MGKFVTMILIYAVLCGVDENQPIAPTIIKRRDWVGSDPMYQEMETERKKRKLVNSTPLKLPLSQLLFTQTNWEVSGPLEKYKSIVREVWETHINDYDWMDIGPNFLIANDGIIFKGRGWYQKGGFISVGYVISFIGSFGANVEPPSTAAILSGIWLLNYALSCGYLDPSVNLRLLSYELHTATLHEIKKQIMQRIPALDVCYGYVDSTDNNLIQDLDGVSFLNPATARDHNVEVRSPSLIYCVEEKSKKLHPFRVQNRIGRGTFGDVFDVIDQTTGCSKALKIQRIIGNAKPNKVYLQMLTTLDHPNVAKYAWIGETLNSLAKRVCMTEEDIVCKAAQMADGLHYLHNLNEFNLKLTPIYLGDLKGENVAVHEGQAIHLDLDNCTKLDGSHTNPSGLKTNAYTLSHTAPEVINEYVTIDVGRRADVYSLGCCILEMFGRGRVHHINKNDRQRIPDSINSALFRIKLINRTALLDFKDVYERNISPHLEDILRNCLCTWSSRLNSKQVLDKLRALQNIKAKGA